VKRVHYVLIVAAVTAFVIWRRRQIADVFGLFTRLPGSDPAGTSTAVLH
jgi:hypothetical protein